MVRGDGEKSPTVCSNRSDARFVPPIPGAFYLPDIRHREPYKPAMRATAPAPLTRHLQEPAIARAPPVAAQPLPPSANVRERCGPKESVPRSEIAGRPHGGRLRFGARATYTIRERGLRHEPRRRVSASAM